MDAPPPRQPAPSPERDSTIESNKLIWACLLLCAAPFFFLAFYAYPTIDDYTFSWCQPSLVQSLLRGNNRHLWVVEPLRHAHATLTGMRAYWVNAWAVLILHGLVIGWAMRSAYRHHLPPKAIAFWSLCFWVVIFANMPDPADSVFWATGAIAYHTGSLLTPPVLLALLGLLRATSSTQRTRRFLLVLALVTLAMFTHWPTIAAVMCMALCCLLWTLIHRDRAWPHMAFVVLLTLCCFVYVATAPGHAAYAAARKGPRTPAVISAKSALSYIDLLGGWVLCPSILLVVPLFAWRLWRSPSWSTRRVRLSPRLLLAFTGIFLASQLCVLVVSYYGGLASAPGRILNVLLFNFVVALVVLASIGSLMAPAELRRQLSPPSALAEHSMAALLIIALLLSPNVRLAANDILSGRCFDYRRQQKAREALVRQALGSGQRSLAVPPITARPRLLWNFDLSTSPDGHPNPSFARHWGLESITLETEKDR